MITFTVSAGDPNLNAEDAEDTEGGRWLSSGVRPTTFPISAAFSHARRVFVANSWAVGRIAAVCARKGEKTFNAEYTEDAEVSQRAEEGRDIAVFAAILLCTGGVPLRERPRK